MQVVILAAGKGTRMNHLTENLPKPMLSVNSKNLLEHKLDSLPSHVDEVILVVGYKNEIIRDYFVDSYKDKKITYIKDDLLTGTAHALWQAKDLLKGRFLVMMGDDIYSKESINECSKYDWSILCKGAGIDEPGGRIILDDKGQLIEFETHLKYKEKFNEGGLIFTGLYSMTTDLFNYEPVKMKTKEEWGLPHTLLVVAKDHPVKIIETDFWLSINSLEDLEKANEVFKSTVI